METERIGPLSYSVDVPAGDMSAERPIVLGSLVALLATLPTLALGWLALGSVSARMLVLVLGSLAPLGLGLAVAYRASPGRRRRRRNALVGAGTVGLFLAIVTFNLLGIVRPALPELRAAMDDVRLPPGFMLVSEDTRGSRMCDPSCPELVRVYRASELEEPGRELLRAMFRQGWDLADPNVPPDSNTAAIRGRIYVDVFSSTGEPTVRVVVSGSAGKGYTGVGGD